MNALDENGATPMEWSIHKTYKKIPNLDRDKFVQLLINNGANVNIQNKDGVPATMLAALTG